MNEQIENLEKILENKRNQFITCDFNDNFSHRVGVCFLGKTNTLRNQAKTEYEKALREYRKTIIKTVRTCQVQKRRCYDFIHIKNLIEFINKLEEAKLHEEKKFLLIRSYQSVEDKFSYLYKTTLMFFSKLPAHKKIFSIIAILPPILMTSPLIVRMLIGIFLSSLSERMLDRLSIKCEKGSCIAAINKCLHDLIEEKATEAMLMQMKKKLDRRITEKKLELAIEKFKPHICNIIMPCKFLPETGINLLKNFEKKST